MRIVIIGAGNVATYLALALHKSGYRIVEVYSRTPESARKLAEKVNATWTCDIEEVCPDADLWIFALTDQAVLDILGRTGFQKSLLVHTAGSLPLNIFSGHSDNYGVLYPLQTFSGHKPPVFSEVPFCIEANTESGQATLENLARAISPLVYKVSSGDREFLHLAAVFACNFSNHMYVLASEIAERAVLPFEMFHSLIRETAEKAVRSGPLTSQTGPAVRNDKIIIKKHLNWLSFSPELRSIYEKLTESICIKAGVPAGSNNSLLNKKMGFFKEELTRVKAFVFDVDGVFSEGILLIDSEGDLIRSMNVKDGYAMQLAARKGYPIAIITGGNSEPVRKRFNMLGVYDVYLGSSKKLDDFTDFCNKHKLAPEDILYMGDDLPDYPVMEKAGFPACPSDAVPEIKQIAGYISGYKGGHGCVRDVIEQVLRVHGVWMGEDTFLL
jgi:YrbI family 3-deoxy-D-manno-octulosonate 8-phosphate phosphatase